MTHRLNCSGLTGGRGRTTAVRDVNLAVGEGEVLALLGPNGSGKTTLLLTIAGLLPRQAGEVKVDGVGLGSGRPIAASRAGVVLVPDNRCLFPTLTVKEHLAVAGGRRAEPRSLLDLFPSLERRWNVAAGALSGGEQQMLAMARALIQQPKVLLLDELSMGLAPLVTEALFNTIRQIATEHGCATVLVEQHVNLALEVADTAVVLTRGEIVLGGSSAEIISRPDVLEQAYLGSFSDSPGSGPEAPSVSSNGDAPRS